MTKAIVEPTSPNREWVWHYEWNSDGEMTRMMMPSAMSSYDSIDDMSGPSYTASTNSGLVYAYDYTSDHRRTKTYVREGNDASLANFTLTMETVYPTSPTSDERVYLPTAFKRYRDPVNQTADDIEVTSYIYKFHSATDKIGWIATTVEAETVAENGPGGTHTSHELFSANGLNEWGHTTDNILVRREYNATTGALERITRNADVDNLTPGDYGLSGSDVSTWRDMPAASLVTEFYHDLMGRVVLSVSPGGVNTYIVREMKEDSQRPNLLYYTVTTLPHKLSSSSFDGPARVAWYTAEGNTTRRSEYSIDGTETYTPYNPADHDAAAEFTLDVELSRSIVVHNLSGLITKRRIWHDVNNVWHAGTAAYDETTYDYDDLGRLSYVTYPTGTIGHPAVYDVLNRVLSVEIGTTTMNTATVAEYFYDSGGALSQGIGDGNITVVRASTGDNGTLTASARITKTTYDFRNRPVLVETPQAPYQYMTYDNLSRVVERAVFEGPTVPIAIDDPPGQRGAYIKSFYSQRGMMYKQQVAINPTLGSPDFLETNSWFDKAGRTIAAWAPNAPAVKTMYDELGRTAAVYTTDRSGDALPGLSGNHADASALTGDRILEQAEYTYNDHNRIELVETTHRIHDTTNTGALTSSSGVQTWVGYAYDAADRRVRTINFGTNAADFRTGGTAPAWPDGTYPIPDWDTTGYDGYIVTGVAFNDRGLSDVSIDSLGRETKMLYDDRSRTIATIENYEDAVVAWNGADFRWEVTSGLDHTEPDTDRVTSFVYNGVGKTVLQIAHTPDGSDNELIQATEYYYGVTTGSAATPTDSLVYSNDLLKEVRYPDESTGAPGSTDAYKVKYSYNRLGEIRSISDQNGTRHDYHQDGLGRITQDVASVIGTDIDDWARRIEFSYTGMGQIATITTFDATAAGNELNGVEFTYTPLQQIERLFQDHDSEVTRTGDTPTGNTAVVAYTYATAEPVSGTAGSNHSRIASITYPFGTSYLHEYGSSGTINDRISRIAFMGPFRGFGFTPAAVYNYVGQSMFAEVDYAAIDVQLDRTLTHDGKRRTQGYTTGTSGHYPGWDRFGREVRNVWVDGSLDEHDSLTTVPNIPPIFEETYTYDQSSNRLSKLDARPGAGWEGRDFTYSYDALDRLTTALRGGDLLGGTPKYMIEGSQHWDLDMLGNWQELQTDLEDGMTGYGDGVFNGSDASQTRTHNAANEIVTLDPDGAGGTPSQAMTWDAAGQFKAWSARDREATHDAWGRMTSVIKISDDYPYGLYEYNGLHWRTRNRVNTDYVNVVTEPDEERIYYYNASWRLIEERIDDLFDEDTTLDRVGELFWGSRYIDDLVMRRLSDDPEEGTPTFTFWQPITDAMFSVRAILASDASVAERVNYDAYGIADHHWNSDLDGDGDVDTNDATLLSMQVSLGSNLGIGESNYRAEYDLDRDGSLTFFDLSAIGGAKSALPAGHISGREAVSDPATLPDNPVGYDGYIFSPEVDSYHVRFRWYTPELGRWWQRDPAGYIGGMSLYQYVMSRCTSDKDPKGLDKVSYEDMIKYVEACRYDLPQTASDTRKELYEKISAEMLLCLFWLESSFNTSAVSNSGDHIGLGQMSENACKGVDDAFKLKPGTCWKAQQSGDVCDQIKNTIGYILHIWVNPKAFTHPEGDEGLRDVLRIYGGHPDGKYDTYTDPILDCAECLRDKLADEIKELEEKRKQEAEEAKKNGVSPLPNEPDPKFCNKDNAQSCFDALNQQVREARNKEETEKKKKN